MSKGRMSKRLLARAVYVIKIDMDGWMDGFIQRLLGARHHWDRPHIYIHEKDG